MRIQVWSDYYWPRVGGTEYFLECLLTGLLERGHEANVISSQAHPPLEKRDRHRGVQINRFPIPEVLHRRNLREIRLLQDEIKTCTETFQPDVHFLNSGHSAPFFLERINRLKRTPSLVTMHSELPFLVDRNSLTGRALCHANRLVAVSRYVERSVTDFHPEFATKTKCIHNGCPWPTLAVQPIENGGSSILGIGRFIPEKGFDVLLLAFARVIRTLPDARLTLVGDGPEYSKLRQQAVDAGLAAVVNFTGYLSEAGVRSEIDRCSLVAVPSLWQEPFGYVALQAMQQGRPVVASDVGGLPELIVDRMNGRLLPAGNVEVWAECLIDLLRDRQDLKRMGDSSIDRFRRKFSFEKFLNEYEKIMRCCISEW